MTYRADFYIEQNIIGYTGNIEDHPTVYFKTGPAHGPNEYGHITQAHQIGPNIGREEVRRSAHYEMRAGANGNLEEWDAGRLIHPSRNPFISIANLDHRAKYLLSCAIPSFKEKKQWGDYTQVQQDQILDHGRLISGAR